MGIGCLVGKVGGSAAKTRDQSCMTYGLPHQPHGSSIVLLAVQLQR